MIIEVGGLHFEKLPRPEIRNLLLQRTGLFYICPNAPQPALREAPSGLPKGEGDIQPGRDRAISPVLPRLTSVNVEHFWHW